MNKRHALLLTAVLGMAAAQAQTVTPTATPTVVSEVNPAIADPQLSSARVTVEVGSYSGPLSGLLGALAKSAGYGLILETDVDSQPNNVSGVSGTTNTAGNSASAVRPLVYSFKQAPFNEVWPLVMDVAGLSYEIVQVGGKPVLRVSNKPVQSIVKLKYVAADYAYEKVLQFFGDPIFSDNPQKDASGNVVGFNRVTTGYKIPSNTFKLVADTEGSALVVGGTSSEVNAVKNFLRSIDIQTNAGATTAAKAATLPSVQQVYAVKGEQADVVDLLKAQFSTLKVVPVGKTGQLVISGPKDQMDAALALLSQVDKVTAPVESNPTVQKVFQLVNASAEELKATLENTLAREVATQAVSPVAQPVASTDANGNPVVTPAQTTTTTPVAANTSTTVATTTTTAPTTTGTGQQATIIADRRTNTLIVRGTQRQVDQIAELIPQLDRVVPQINVQVRIQEITEEAGRTLGINWRANFGGFTVTAGSGGFGGLFNPTQSLVGFNILPTLTALETQNLSKKVYDGSVTMQSGQRSLGNSTATQNSSSAAAATVKSGGKLDINLPSTAANVPALQKEVDYGVVLDFFNPQVAPDGTITMRVRGQVSDLLNASGVTPNLIRMTNSEAQSTVTFKNGETILLSGLMGSTETSAKAGLPFLTSTPLNMLAGRTETKKSATQLLVVITGTIVK